MVNQVQSLRSNVAGARPAGKAVGSLYTNFADRQIGVVDPAQAPVDLIGVRYFSPTAAYVAGDFVIQGGQLYRAKAAVPAGAFNAGQWDNVLTAASPLVSSFNTRTGAVVFTAADLAAVTTIVSSFNGRTGAVVLSGADITGAGGALAANSVSSFNTRTGAVVLNTADITGAGGAPINSPAFTGAPTAPTPAAGNSSQAIATTAFVSALGAGNAFVPTVSQISVGTSPAGYGSRFGRYVRVGSLVFASYFVGIAGKGTLDANWPITFSLPVPAQANSSCVSLILSGTPGFVFTAPNSYALAVVNIPVVGSNNVCALYQMGSSGAIANLTGAQIDNNQGFIFNLTYEAA